MRNWCNIKGGSSRSKWTTRRHTCNDQFDITGFVISGNNLCAPQFWRYKMRRTYMHHDRRQMIHAPQLYTDDLGMCARAWRKEIMCTAIFLLPNWKQAWVPANREASTRTNTSHSLLFGWAHKLYGDHQAILRHSFKMENISPLPLSAPPTNEWWGVISSLVEDILLGTMGTST